MRPPAVTGESYRALQVASSQFVPSPSAAAPFRRMRRRVVGWLSQQPVLATTGQGRVPELLAGAGQLPVLAASTGEPWQPHEGGAWHVSQL